MHSNPLRFRHPWQNFGNCDAVNANVAPMRLNGLLPSAMTETLNGPMTQSVMGPTTQSLDNSLITLICGSGAGFARERCSRQGRSSSIKPARTTSLRRRFNRLQREVDACVTTAKLAA